MLTKRDVLDALGIEQKEDRYVAGMMLGVGIGLLVGGIVSMLLAPQTGADLRQTIGERGRNLVNRVRGGGNGGMTRAEGMMPGETGTPPTSTEPIR